MDKSEKAQYAKIEALRKKWENFPLSIEEVKHFMDWYEKDGQIVSHWDDFKYEFCCDVKRYGIKT